MAAIAPYRTLEEPSPMMRPERFLTRMILFLVVVGSVAALLFPALRAAFMNNPALNGLILGTLLAGILFIFSIDIRFRQKYNEEWRLYEPEPSHRGEAAPRIQRI